MLLSFIFVMQPKNKERWGCFPHKMSCLEINMAGNEGGQWDHWLGNYFSSLSEPCPTKLWCDFFGMTSAQWVFAQEGWSILLLPLLPCFSMQLQISLQFFCGSLFNFSCSSCMQTWWCWKLILTSLNICLMQTHLRRRKFWKGTQACKQIVQHKAASRHEASWGFWCKLYVYFYRFWRCSRPAAVSKRIPLKELC